MPVSFRRYYRKPYRSTKTYTPKRSRVRTKTYKFKRFHKKIAYNDHDNNITFNTFDSE